VLSCTGSLAAADGTSAILTVVCKDGFYKNAVNTCFACNTAGALKTTNGNDIEGTGGAKIATCGITGTAYAVLTSLTCSAGYGVTKHTSGSFTGCTVCGATAANYKSCTVTDVSAW